LAQRATGWQAVVLGHREDEVALVRFQAFEESVNRCSVFSNRGR
jgi:hypothetical protein